jgi:hypothetical protein
MLAVRVLESPERRTRQMDQASDKQMKAGIVLYSRLVREDPVEYIKKVAYSVFLMLRGGFYSGTYQDWAAPAEGTDQELQDSLLRLDIRHVFRIFQREGLLFAILGTIQILVKAYSILLFLCFNLLLLWFLIKRYYRSDYLLSCLFLTAILYQYAVCLLAYYMTGYITNLYLIYLSLIFWTIDGFLKGKETAVAPDLTPEDVSTVT